MARFTFDGTVKAKPDEFFDWWANFTSGDHEGPNWPPKLAYKRTVLEQDDHRAVVEDHIGRINLHVTVTKHRPSGLESAGESRIVSTRGRVVLTPVENGTRLHFESEFTPHGVARLFFPLMKGRVFERITQDIEAHLKDFYTDTGRQP